VSTCLHEGDCKLNCEARVNEIMKKEINVEEKVEVKCAMQKRWVSSCARSDFSSDMDMRDSGRELRNVTASLETAHLP
jgi:hypothetical protein